MYMYLVVGFAHKFYNAGAAWSLSSSEEDAPFLEFCSIDCHGCSERLEVKPKCSPVAYHGFGR